jgi:hypothetical protein
LQGIDDRSMIGTSESATLLDLTRIDALLHEGRARVLQTFGEKKYIRVHLPSRYQQINFSHMMLAINLFANIEVTDK